MKTHHMSASGAPATCKRVPDAIANKTTEWRNVTCGWCLKHRPNEPPYTDKPVQALLDNEAHHTMPLYVVEALRGGSRERHSYVVGVYDTLDGAKNAAEAEANYRGGKYTCEVTAHPFNGEGDTRPLLVYTNVEK